LGLHAPFPAVISVKTESTLRQGAARRPGRETSPKSPVQKGVYSCEETAAALQVDLPLREGFSMQELHTPATLLVAEEH